MTCSICREEGSDFVTRCKHDFHFACASSFILKNGNCPYCRRPVTANQKLEQLFLSFKGTDEEILKLDLDSIHTILLFLNEFNEIDLETLIKRLKELKWRFSKAIFENKTVLHLFVEHGKTGHVAEIVEAGARIDSLDIYKQSALSIACSKANLELVKELISCGASLESGNPLFTTIRNGHLDIFDYILETKPESLHILDDDNRTLLHEAAIAGNLQLFKKLSMMGLDIKRKDRFGYTVLHSVCECPTSNDLIGYLLELGMDPNEKTLKALTPLEIAATYSNSLDTVKLLIDHGAKIEPDAIFCAFDNNQITFELVQLFINYEVVDLNAHDSNDRTALMMAVEKQDVPMVKLLLEKGADPKIESMFFGTALHVALMGHSEEIIELLIKNGCQIFLKDSDTSLSNAIHGAYSNNNYAMLPKLMELGASIDCRDVKGKTILHLAAKEGNLEQVKNLVKMGAEVNAADYKGYLSLDFAKDKDVIKYLIKKGATRSTYFKRFSNCFSA